MAWELSSVRHSPLASSVSGWWLTLCLPSSQNSLSLVPPPILPAWLLANQHFIKPTWVTNFYSVQKHYPKADQSSAGLDFNGVASSFILFKIMFFFWKFYTTCFGHIHSLSQFSSMIIFSLLTQLWVFYFFPYQGQCVLFKYFFMCGLVLVCGYFIMGQIGKKWYFFTH